MAGVQISLYSEQLLAMTLQAYRTPWNISRDCLMAGNLLCLTVVLSKRLCIFKGTNHLVQLQCLALVNLSITYFYFME